MSSLYNPGDTRLVSDPHPLYHRLRTEDPVHWSDLMQAWVLTRYDDVAGVLMDRRFSVDRRKALGGSGGSPFKLEEFGPFAKARMIVNADPPEHTRLRRLVNKAFTMRMVEGLRPRIAQIVERLLDRIQESGRCDFVGDFAYPLPVTVIAEMLGVPVEDQSDFRRWSSDIAAAAGPALPPEAVDQAARSIEQMAEYFRQSIRDHRRAHGNDLISALLAAEEEGQVLNEDELLVTLMFLLIAGHETTTNLLGNGMLALFRHADQFRRLRDEPALVRFAVEELLRCEGPLQAAVRVATVDVEIRGRGIRAGQLVVAVLAAANRDPEVFPEPDELRIERRPNEHLAFGGGVHTCLGASLARAEAQTALSGFLARFPNPRLEIDPDRAEWRGHFAARGLAALPVAV